jgi:RNA polymerase sigma factor (sigma-70 family)
MSTVQAPTALGAIHMRVVYFAADSTAPTASTPLLPADLTRVFRQLDLLVEYAELLTQAASPALVDSPWLRTATRTALRDIRDDDLVAAVRAGDDRAFELLFERYRARISAYVHEMIRDHDRAEDITQDVFIMALRRMRETDRALTFKPWIYALARKACVDALRRMRMTSALSPDTEMDEASPVSQPASPSSKTPRHASVISLRMGSPLDVVLEIPIVAWSFVGLGLLALAERIATAPVRIARKRRQELLKTAVIDRQTQLINDGKADVLAQLLLKEGPRGPTRGPDDITLFDPADPGDELDPAHPRDDREV